MMNLALLVCLVAVCSAAPLDKNELTRFAKVFMNPQASTRDVCTIVDVALNFLRPGVETWFDQQCIPQIQAEVDACNGNLQSQGATIVNQLCTAVADDLVSVIERLPWQSVQNSLVPFFQPGGVFISQCKADAGAYIIGEINQECASVNQLNPDELCANSFQELWNEVISSINGVLCGSK